MRAVRFSPIRITAARLFVLLSRNSTKADAAGLKLRLRAFRGRGRELVVAAPRYDQCVDTVRQSSESRTQKHEGATSLQAAARW